MNAGTAPVLLVAPDDTVRRSVSTFAIRVRLRVAESSRLALSRFFEQTHPALVIIGPELPKPWDALALARLVRQWAPGVPVVLVTSHGSEDLAVAAMRTGVNDYFRAPADPDDLARGLRRLLEPCADENSDKLSGPGRVSIAPFVGVSRAANAIRASIDKVARADSTTLVTGETGTGKELAARLIHAGSRRSKRAFVSINCAAIPEALVESELFGYERGAFTGAGAASRGRVSAANHGTAFFDEVGDLSPTAQAKVLRLVEDKEVQRLGAAGSVSVDARIVAATNRNLDGLMTEGVFRRDLYFRLDVARIHLPPLRERREDIPVLLTHYVQVLRQQLHRDIEGFTPDALEALTGYDWPGNIRELRNLVERLIINATSPLIDVPDLPGEFNGPPSGGAPVAERTRMLEALSRANGNKTAAARALGCSRMTFYRRMVKYEVLPHSPAKRHGVTRRV